METANAASMSSAGVCGTWVIVGSAVRRAPGLYMAGRHPGDGGASLVSASPAGRAVRAMAEDAGPVLRAPPGRPPRRLTGIAPTDDQPDHAHAGGISRGDAAVAGLGPGADLPPVG